MGDISLMDIFKGAAGVAQQAIQHWGVREEPRRAAQYQSALTKTREGFSALYESIQRSPDYQLYENMFTEGATKIQEQVTKDYLSDPAVKQQFDLQWMTLQEAARGSVQQYAFNREKVAITTEQFGNMMNALTLNPTFEAAQVEAAAIVSSLYETGMLDEAGVAEFWGKYRGQGAILLETRIKDGIENPNREMGRAQVKASLDGAFATEIIGSEEVYLDRLQRAMYDIDVLEVTDQAMAYEGGIEAGMDWVANDPDVAAKINYPDRNTIWLELRSKLQWGWSMEQREIDVKDRTWREVATDEIHTKALNDDEYGWAEALAWLDQPEILAGMKQETTDYYRRLWSGLLDAELSPPGDASEFFSRGDAAVRYEKIVQMIIAERPQSEVAMFINQSALRDPAYSNLIALDKGDLERLRDMNDNRSSRTSEEEDMIEASLSGYEDLNDAEQQLITYQLRRALPGISVNPDGTSVDPHTLMLRMNEAVKHLAEPVRAARVNATTAHLETIFGGGGANLIRDQEVLSSQIDQNLFRGTVDTQTLLEAVRLGTTNEDTLRDMFTPDIDLSTLSNEQKIVIENQIQFAKLAASHAGVYEQWFGRKPRISHDPNETEMVALDDGSVAFYVPDTDMLVQLQVRADVSKDEQWYAYVPMINEWMLVDALNRDPRTDEEPETGTGFRVQEFFNKIGAAIETEVGVIRTHRAAQNSSIKEQLTALRQTPEWSVLNPTTRERFEVYINDPNFTTAGMQWTFIKEMSDAGIGFVSRAEVSGE